MWIIDQTVTQNIIEMDIVNDMKQRQQFDDFYQFHESSYLDCEIDIIGVYQFEHEGRTVCLSEDPIALSAFVES